jgi:hypothetical protein
VESQSQAFVLLVRHGEYSQKHGRSFASKRSRAEKNQHRMMTTILADDATAGTTMTKQAKICFSRRQRQCMKRRPPPQQEALPSEIVTTMMMLMIRMTTMMMTMGMA